MSSASILKALFSSQTRVKLLSTFLLHPEREYFIRELTRLLSEQINSIRRELENLRRVGLVSARHRNRKKYYRVEQDFLLYGDLRSLFSKVVQGESPLVHGLRNLPYVKYSIFSEADFLYRLSLKDRFVTEILCDPRHLIVVNKMQPQIEEARGKK